MPVVRGKLYVLLPGMTTGKEVSCKQVSVKQTTQGLIRQ